jgi:predicted  nucleic acid-binding Zn-ribbon protein
LQNDLEEMKNLNSALKTKLEESLKSLESNANMI